MPSDALIAYWARLKQALNPALTDEEAKALTIEYISHLSPTYIAGLEAEVRRETTT